jgi:hypothetical protein
VFVGAIVDLDRRALVRRLTNDELALILENPACREFVTLDEARGQFLTDEQLRIQGQESPQSEPAKRRRPPPWLRLV